MASPGRCNFFGVASPGLSNFRGLPVQDSVFLLLDSGAGKKDQQPCRQLVYLPG